MEPELISVNDAARVIGIGRTQLYKMLSTGQIASVKVGKSRLIPARALRQWVDDLVAAQTHGTAASDLNPVDRRGTAGAGGL